MAKAGKKPLVDEEVDLIFRKFEPYLKKGLSLKKACIEAKFPSLQLMIYTKNIWSVGVRGKHTQFLNNRSTNFY